MKDPQTVALGTVNRPQLLESRSKGVKGIKVPDRLSDYGPAFDNGMGSDGQTPRV
jgi:hypothetical protein